jgi:FkbM family methyltransferase
MIAGKATDSCEYFHDTSLMNFSNAEVCHLFSAGLLEYPEWFVRETVASFLVPCLYRKCVVLDLGANLGYVTSWMASLGAHVTAIEPQKDLVKALRSTLRVNCWEDRVSLHNAFVSWDEKNVGESRTATHLWRANNKAAVKTDHFTAPYFVLPVELSKDSMRKIDFIKLDIDSFELEIIEFLESFMARTSFQFTTLLFEISPHGGHARGDRLGEVLCRFQNKHGYNIYKMNQHEQRRWLNSKGVDVYSRHQEVYGDQPWLEDRFNQRFMRFLLYIKPEPSCEEWPKFINKGMKKRAREMNGKGQFTNSFLVTREELLEPVHMEPHGYRWPSPEANRYFKADAQKKSRLASMAHALARVGVTGSEIHAMIEKLDKGAEALTLAGTS